VSQTAESIESRSAVPVCAKCPLPREYVAIVAFDVRMIHLLCRINTISSSPLRRSIECRAMLQECDERSPAKSGSIVKPASCRGASRQSPIRRAWTVPGRNRRAPEDAGRATRIRANVRPLPGTVAAAESEKARDGNVAGRSSGGRPGNQK
jgi:hypothetical protein